MTYYAPNFPPNGPANFPPNMRPVYRGGGEFPRSLFPSGTTGAWFDISDLSTLYQTDDTSTPVTALGQQFGRATDKSGSGAHATQATASLRPTLPAAGYRLRSDFSNDVLSCTLASARDMYVSTPYGAYKSQANAGAVRLPLNDATEVVACATLSAAQEDALYRYFGVDEKYLVMLINSTSVSIRVYALSTPVDVLFVGANGTAVTKTYTTDTTPTYDLSADGLTAPVAAVFPESLITSTALRTFRVDSGSWVGTLPNMSLNTGTTVINFAANRLTGGLQAVPASVQFLLLNDNQFSGLIQNLSSCTNLQQAHFHSNQLTGWTGGTVSNTLGDFRADGNLLTQAAVDAILAAFVAANRTTGTRVLNIGGTGNAAPSAAGVTDKNTLISRGWTVTTN